MVNFIFLMLAVAIAFFITVLAIDFITSLIWETVKVVLLEIIKKFKKSIRKEQIS